MKTVAQWWSNRSTVEQLCIIALPTLVVGAALWRKRPTASSTLRVVQGPSLPSLRSKSEHGVEGPGLDIEQGKVNDWNRWMDEGPEAIELAMQEGATEPADILANALRRLYPQYHWPPLPGSRLEADWQLMLAAFGRVLEKPFQTRFQVVS